DGGLKKPPTDALRPIIPDNACILCLTAATGTELADAYSPDTVIASSPGLIRRKPLLGRIPPFAPQPTGYYLCDPQWFRDTASRGPTTIVAPESQFRSCPTDHGIIDSACKNQLVVVSVQYGPFNPYIPIRSTTIGKSRVAIDPIAMHIS
ncbi:hypothetical protein F511_34987, partial [Dorcoceras hygrometricum]